MPTKLPRYRTAAEGIAARMRERGEEMNKGEVARAAAALGAGADLAPSSAPAAVIARHVNKRGPADWDWAPRTQATDGDRVRLRKTFVALLRAAGVEATELPEAGVLLGRSLVASRCLLRCGLLVRPEAAAADLAASVADVAAAHAMGLRSVPEDERAYFPPPDCGAYLGAAFGSDMRVPPQFVSSTARHLAGVIHREETWTVLPILADALQDEGAPDDAEYMKYLRSEGPFFRGCLAVDSCRGVA